MNLRMLLPRTAFAFVAAGALSVSVRGNDAPPMPEEIFPQLVTILQDALEQSPRMLVQRLELDVAAGDLQQAKSGLYPTVGGSYQQTETRDEREDLAGRTIDTSKTYYSFSLAQPLFHWGERANNAKAGEIRAKIAEKQYEDAYRLLAREIRWNYLNLISIKAQVAGTRFDQARADQALKAAEERVASKLMSAGEAFPLRIAAEQAALALASAEAGFLDAKQQFELLTGKPAPTDDQIPDIIPTQAAGGEENTYLLAEFIGQSAPDTPTLAALRNQIEVDRLGYLNQRKRLLPKLNFVLGISQDEQSYTINNAQKYGVLSQFVGLQVNWQIFDGFATRGAVRTALARQRQSEMRYKNTVASQKRQAEAAVRAVDIARRQMAISDRMLDNSQSYLTFRENDFKRGNASESDVEQAKSGFNSSKVSAINARINFLMKQVDFISLIARDPAMRFVTFDQ